MHHYHHHHRIAATNHRHHHRFHHTSTVPNEPLTYEEQVKVAKASIIMGAFIIFFAISMMIGLSYLVLSSDYIPNLLLILFILFPTIMIIVGLVRIVRCVRFLKSEPPSSEE